jgi:acyl-CoA reductase-like NAD-dependent aldehyde dehydrogenase
MKWSEMMEGAQAQTAGAVAAGTGAVQAAAGKVDSALQTFQKMTPEEREKLTEKMADGIADDLSRT